MATTNNIYILGVSIISGIATIFHIMSLSTEQWVTSTIFQPQSDNRKSSFNYGLFKGNYARDMTTYSIYEVESKFLPIIYLQFVVSHKHTNITMEK